MSRTRYPRPAILARLPPDRHAVIEASAGTGKTYTLEHLVIDRLLQGGLSIGQILVVTFTEKAASEMRQRIRKLIGEMLEVEEGAGAELDPSESWHLDAEARSRLQRALREFDTAPISTIHSFCQRILSEQAFASQRLFSETLLPSRELFTPVFYDLLRRQFSRGEDAAFLQLWLERGSVEELEVLLFEASKFPGRIEPAFDEELPDRILASFPKEEDDSDVLKRLPLHGSTRKALLKRMEILRTRLLDLEALGAGAAWTSRWAVLDELHETTGYLRGALEAHEGAGPTIDRLLRCVREIDERTPTMQGLVVGRFLPSLQVALAERKMQEGLLDFNDMLVALRDGLCGAHGENLTGLLRERYRLALIDEFQDTDEVQWEIFRRIFFEGKGDNRLALIGDPKQAIYRFRGADVETYLRARKEVFDAGGAVVYLEHCFRATHGLIEGYNRVFDQKAEAPFFSGAIRYEPAVSCGDPSLRLVDAGGEDVSSVHLWGMTVRKGRSSQKPVLVPLAERVAREIRALTSSKEGLRFIKEGKARPLGHRDIFILHRSAAEGRVIGEVLRREGIPYSFVKAEGLFERPEATAWLDLLAAVARPEERSLRMRAWMSPFFDFSFDSLQAAMDLPATAPPWVQLRSWKEDADNRRYERLFSRILDESGVLQREILTGDDRALTNFLHISELLLERVGQSRGTLEELVAWLRALVEGRERLPGEDEGQQRLDTEKEAVQIMTMHASKGLEAAVVFVVGGLRPPGGGKKGLVSFHHGEERIAWAGMPPRWVSEQVQREARWEDERLLYVALTRAKGRLYLPLYLGDEFQPTGAYAAVNQRLRRLVEAGEGALPDGYVLEELTELPVAEEGDRGAAATWSPLALPEPGDRGEEARMARLRQERLGFEITSYTRLRGFRAAGEIEQDEFTGEDLLVVQPGPDDLPGGAATGIFLHEVLARLPKEQAFGEWEVFRSHPAVGRIFQEEARRHGIRERHLEHAMRLVFAGITETIPLRGDRRMEGVIAADRWLHEMEFLYPYPEEGHPLLGAPGPEDGYAIERGFIKGFVDLIFEKDGVFYFADWKSDNLPAFGASIVQAHVKKSYELQAQLYALALVKLLGIRSEEEHERRFGGLYYFFLRGMLAGGEAGIHFERPDWKTLLSWEQALVNRGRA